MTEATCPSCQTVVRVDLSRVPAGKAARVGCPGCKNAFAVSAAAAPEPAALGAPAAVQSEAGALASAAGRDEAWIRKELEALRGEIEKNVTEKVLSRVLGALGKPMAGAVEEDEGDAKPALVCESDSATAAYMSNVLRELGYTPQAAPDLQTAWRALDTDQRVVIVCDTLPDDAEAATKILERLSRLPGAKRRRMFVAYVGKDVQTIDGGVAFVLGVNMTIFRGDLQRLKDLLRRGMAERDKTYRPFLAALEALSEGHGA